MRRPGGKRLLTVAWTLGLALLIVLLLRSPSVQLWMGRDGERARRLYPHHLLPLQVQARQLRARFLREPLPEELGPAVEVYRARQRAVRSIRNAGLRVEALEETWGEVELDLARALLGEGLGDRAEWHLLEAARRLRPGAGLRQTARLARQNASWQALAVAWVRLDEPCPLDGGGTTELLPPGQASRAAVHLWLGRCLLERGKPDHALRHWRSCARLGMASCASALAEQARATGNGPEARRRHREALRLDPLHWPSLWALYGGPGRGDWAEDD